MDNDNGAGTSATLLAAAVALKHERRGRASHTWYRAGSSTSTSLEARLRSSRVTRSSRRHQPKIAAMAEQAVAYDEEPAPGDLILEAVDVVGLMGGVSSPAIHAAMPGSGVRSDGEGSDSWTPIALPRTKLAAHRDVSARAD